MGLNVGFFFFFTFITLSFKFYKLINLRVFWTSKLRNPNRGSPLNSSIDKETFGTAKKLNF